MTYWIILALLLVAELFFLLLFDMVIDKILLDSLTEVSIHKHDVTTETVIIRVMEPSVIFEAKDGAYVIER